MAAKEQGKVQRYPLVEWVSAAVGVLITGAILGVLGYEAALQRNGRPPVMEVVPVAVVAARNTYVVEIRVKNLTHKTAAAVVVEGALKQGDTIVETSNATFDYVPGGSHRDGGLVFTRDPRQFRVVLRVTGYERP